MNLFKMFGRTAPSSAPVARERLQILLAHERKSASTAELIHVLQRDVLQAISKHIEIDPAKVDVKIHQRDEQLSMLEIDVELGAEAIDAFAAQAKDKAA